MSHPEIKKESNKPSASPDALLQNLKENLGLGKDGAVTEKLAEMRKGLEESGLGEFVAEALALFRALSEEGGEEKKDVGKTPENPSTIPTTHAQSISSSLTAKAHSQPSSTQPIPAQELPETLPETSHQSPVNRTVQELKAGGSLSEELYEDHKNNLALLSLALGKNKDKQVSRFLETYEANKHRYKKVSEATNLPPILIATLHEMESSMNFNTYLHNGQRLGQVTTFVPKGILFQSGEWEQAAIHALGGNIVDANGNKSKSDFQNLRQSLGITAQTTDMAKLMAFAERYNGLGYRSQGVRSAYVYGGTNLADKGMYVADGKFDKTKMTPRVGVAGLMIAQQAKERGGDSIIV